MESTRGWTGIEADNSSIPIRGKAQHTAPHAERLAEVLMEGCTDSLPIAFIFRMKKEARPSHMNEGGSIALLRRYESYSKSENIHY